MMDSDPDNTAEPGAITGDWDDGADGLPCGTADALACLTACFTGTGKDAVPAPSVLLPPRSPQFPHHPIRCRGDAR